ncbi:glycerophosphodiester phosphodiesterase [Puerhibacterium puerhi]|uniref:glycerophosphodiester phosphodiesterase n=1 Tax=Puerhibacterium puerhi TaxID=2692623 RepID=UPI0019166D04|nr:glycerophosphodiester phosphodiesterase family protein [Puerhibacterium puerhi]
MGFLVAGHRGAMAHAPENTMRSFRLAADVGADEIELDVHLSRDGELVVIHDETLERTTDGRGAVADHDWADLAALDAGRGERIPRLAEVLDALPAMSFQVEVKAPAATTGVLAALAERRGRPGAVVVTSFRPEALVPALLPGRWWHVGLICARGDAEAVATASRLGVDRLYLPWDLAGTPAAAAFAAAGGLAFVGPCDDAEAVRRAIDAGFRGTTADDPAATLAVRDAVLAAG